MYKCNKAIKNIDKETSNHWHVKIPRLEAQQPYLHIEIKIYAQYRIGQANAPALSNGTAPLKIYHESFFCH